MRRIQQHKDYIRDLEGTIRMLRETLSFHENAHPGWIMVTPIWLWANRALSGICVSFTALLINSALHRSGIMPAWLRWTRYFSMDAFLNGFGRDPYAPQPAPRVIVMIPNAAPNLPAAMPAAPVPGQPGYWVRVGEGRNLAQN